MVLICCFNLINFRLWYEDTLKYLGESVTGSEIRIWNWWDGSCVAVRDGRVGMPMDVQAGQHDSTVHAQGFSCLKSEADVHDIIRWCLCHYAYIEDWGLYKESTHKPWGSHLGFWLHYIQLHFMRSHRLSLVATSVPLEEWDYNSTGKCSLFVQL